MVHTVKLATRQHSHPRVVIGAYANQSFAGDLLSLTEPGFSTAFAPFYIDNQAFPPDWAEHMAQCPDNCDSCHYCQDVLKLVLKNSTAIFWERSGDQTDQTPTSCQSDRSPPNNPIRPIREPSARKEKPVEPPALL